jgi:cellulose synthase/poly-beta-1,6-N-acetylglucosamine synthase-like glycosyltransferase
VENKPMSVVGVLQNIVITATVIFAGFYICYAALCFSYVRRTGSSSVEPIAEQDAPTITVIVPIYNEESMVARRIENFKALKYAPNKLQVVFVDGASTDSGPAIIEQMSGSLNMALIRQNQREGFNKAVVDGFKASSGSIISITGAETEFESDALFQMVKHFSRADVGAVTGRMITSNQQVLSGKVEKAYRSLYDFMRQAESLMDSCFDIKGELCAARREIVAQIIESPGILTKGSIDTCFAFQSRTMGLRTVYEPRAVYYEDAAHAMRESFQQRIRRGQVHIEAMSLYKEMYFNPSYGIFGLLIAPAHLAMVVILPLLFGLQIFSLASLIAVNAANLLALTLIFLEVGVIALSRHAQAFAQVQFSLIAALIRLLFGWKAYGTGHTRLPSTRLVREKTQISK